jgi:transposase InsO family protein
LDKWVKLYREQGEAGLQSRPRPAGRPRPQVAAAVKTKVVELKRRHPDLGIQKISQFLRRVFFLPVSRETVRRTLQEQQLLKQRKPKPPRNPPKPRFFERSTPNQLWQTDIFTFRLGAKNAYLIGFLDDYSRYVVGLDLFRSQTAEHVLEVYRTAIAEYGVPKEMLSDQGRQYSSWRGTTRFEAELRKDWVHHLKSRPHHPMTLGKIERFWKTIWEEFLVRAQFDSFESARERVRLWGSSGNLCVNGRPLGERMKTPTVLHGLRNVH